MIDNYIIGVDECGYGAWAGPIVIGAVRAPQNWSFDGLKDSKKLTREQRKYLENSLLKLVKQNIIQYKICISTNEEIDNLGLKVCHKVCCVNAINTLYNGTETVIMDGKLNVKHFIKHGLKESCQFRSEIKADDKFPTVMAASILAKEFRDNIMINTLHPLHPEYEWNNNVGYIVNAHKQAVKRYGLTKFHRKSYNVKYYI